VVVVVDVVDVVVDVVVDDVVVDVDVVDVDVVDVVVVVVGTGGGAHAVAPRITVETAATVMRRTSTDPPGSERVEPPA